MRRAIWVLATLICGPTSLCGQGIKKDDFVRDNTGAAISGALVRVCRTDTQCTPADQVTIYSDRDLTTQKANPTMTDGNGYYSFYAPPGRYNIRITIQLVSTLFPDVVLGNDPAGNLVVGGPSPWFDVTNAVHAGGASGSAQNTTGSISKNSTTLDLVAAQDFKDGQGIAVFGAGPNPTITTPTGLAVAAQHVAATITATGVTRSANVVTITTTSQHYFVVGQSITIADTAGCATSPNGTFPVVSAPLSGVNTFTYSQVGPNESCGGGTATPATGGTPYSYQVAAIDNKGGVTAPTTTVTITNGNATLGNTNYNQLIWNPVTGAVMYAIYGRGDTRAAIGMASPSSFTTGTIAAAPPARSKMAQARRPPSPPPPITACWSARESLSAE